MPPLQKDECILCSHAGHHAKRGETRLPECFGHHNDEIFSNNHKEHSPLWKAIIRGKCDCHGSFFFFALGMRDECCSFLSFALNGHFYNRVGKCAFR
ncbi:hypothetical protein CDAR_471231 [Caerostris darwini]|uniref:Uncharacterized protein n=1 Tax=Caerostris darwini TaxID=1538125 RepID=A0AAV4QPC3_9ARAC|nr:hypothetical protein CDAR_471231 [Caerostris darwini]